jgi:uncharacterized lipoprotein NlpE involved in copper resistance
MRTFKQQLKQNMTLLLFIALFSSYSNGFAETTETADTDTAKAEHHTQNLGSGIYLGFLPCTDCKGVKTTLALNKNNTYILITQYVGKSDREIVEKGKFTWGDNNAIILTPRNNTETRHYSVGDDTLTQLNSNGTPIAGDLADRYILRKKGITEGNAQAASHH